MAGNYDFTFSVGFIGEFKDVTEKVKILNTTLQNTPIKLKTEFPKLATTEAQKALDGYIKQGNVIQELTVKTQQFKDVNGKTHKEIVGLQGTAIDSTGKLVKVNIAVANSMQSISKNIPTFKRMGEAAADWGNRAEAMGAKEKKAIQESSKALQDKLNLYFKLISQGKLKEADRLTDDIKNQNIEFEKQVSLSKRAASGIQNWAASIGTAIKNTISYSLSLGLVREAQQQINKAIQFTIDLNKEMVNIQVLQAEGAQTDEEINSLARAYNSLAKEMGATTVEVARGSVEWLRQGRTIEETTELLKASTMLGKLGALNLADATEYLTSTVNSYKIAVEDTITVVDRLIAVDNNSATSTRELATALRYSAATAAEAGVTLEQLISYTGVVSSVTRINAESIGQAFKTIFARMQDIKSGKIDEDGLGINNVESALSRVDVTLRDSATSFRDFGDVLEDLALKWNTLNEVEQANIGKAIAGVRQQNMFAVLMTNMNKALELQEIQYNSTGLAADRYAIYLKGIEAAQNKAKASMEALFLSYKNFGQLVILFSNLTISIAEFLNSAGGIPVIVTTIISVLLAFSQTALLKAGVAVLGLSKNVATLILQFIAAIIPSNALRLSIAELTTSLIASKAALAATGWGLAIIAIGALISHMIWLSGAEERAVEHTRKLREEFTGLADKLHSLSVEKDSIEELFNSYTKLHNITNRTTEQNKEYYDIQSKLIKMFPSLETHYDKEGRLILAESINLQTLIDLKQKEIDQAKTELDTKAKETTEDAVKKYKKAEIEYSQHQQKMKSYQESVGGVEETFYNPADIQKDLNTALKTMQSSKAEIAKYFSSLGRESKIAFLEALAISGEMDVYRAILDAISGKGGGVKEKVSGEISDFVELKKIKKDDLFYYDELTEKIAEYKDTLSRLAELEKKESLTAKDIIDAKVLGLSVYTDEDGKIKITTESVGNKIQALKALLKATFELDDESLTLIDTLAKERFATEEQTYTIENLISAQKVLKSAMEEQNENGRISLDTALQLIDAGYAEAISINTVTGEITLEKEALYQCSLQKIQAAIAANTTAINDKKMADAARDATNAIWDEIRALEAKNTALGIMKEALIRTHDAGTFANWGSLPSIGGGGGGGGGKSPEELANEAKKKAYEEQIKNKEKLIKLHEKEKDALKEQLEAYKKYISAQKESLKAQKEEREFADEITKKNKSLSDLKKQIAQLALDDSEEAIAKRLELEAEAAEIETDITETKEDRKYDLQVQALDNLQDKFEDAINAQIDGIDSIIDKIREEIDAIRELIEALNNAAKAGSRGGGGGGYTPPPPSEKPLPQTRFGIPQEKWEEINPPYKEYLSGGISLSKTFQKMSKGGIGVVPEGYPDDSYHVGVESGELLMVFNKQQQDLLKKTNFQMPKGLISPTNNMNNSNVTISVAMPITVEGNMDSSTIPQIKKIANQVMTEINKSMITRGYIRTSNQTVS